MHASCISATGTVTSTPAWAVSSTARQQGSCKKQHTVREGDKASRHAAARFTEAGDVHMRHMEGIVRAK